MTVAQTSVIEVPSGKDAAYENFPVGSFLLPAALRPHIAVFYAYARAIDDIADDPVLAPEDKIARLDGFERALLGETPEEAGFTKAHAMRRVLATTNITPRHCVDLISAFKQDAVKQRYVDWSELIDYCNRSAAPVGRFLLDLHGGSHHGYGPADALCNALQVLNHLQDCQDDYRRLDRVYLPTRWLEEEGGGHIADLDRRTTTPALRRVIDRCLDGVDGLLREAERLPLGLASRRLGLESGAILDIARTLSRLLRSRDPLAGRVQLGKSGFVWCCIRGATSALF